MSELPPSVRAAWEKVKKARQQNCERAWAMLEKGKARSGAEAATKAGVNIFYFRKWCARHHRGEIVDIYRKLYSNPAGVHPFTPKHIQKTTKKKRINLPIKCPHCGEWIGA